jgi:diacylglycerol kinase (ATP)
MKANLKGLPRLKKAWGYSINGFRKAWQHEEAFRIESIVCFILLPLSFVVGQTIMDYIILIGSLALLLITELFNSAIETLTDRVGMEQNELSGRTKDIASSTVFIAVFFLIFVWVALIYKRLFIN